LNTQLMSQHVIGYSQLKVFSPFVFLANKRGGDNKLTKAKAFYKLTRDGASCIVV
jgi:hypothetical protein